MTDKELCISYDRLFNTEDGVKILKDLNAFSFLNAPVFSKDALTMAYREGARSVALYIKQRMEGKDGEEERREV